MVKTATTSTKGDNSGNSENSDNNENREAILFLTNASMASLGGVNCTWYPECEEPSRACIYAKYNYRPFFRRSQKKEYCF